MSAIKNISLFIPHVYANFTSAEVFDIIQDQGFGEVKNVDFVAKIGSDGKPYNAVYIHFYHWYDNIVAHNFQERVLNPSKEARIMYDDPWYWLVLQNKGKKHVPGQRKPTIDLYAFTTPEKPVAPMINFRPLNAQRAPKTKSWAQAVQPPAPLNLGSDFDIEAQVAGGEITQGEMDWAWEQMEIQRERDNQCLISIDGRYVQSLEQENEILRAQMSYFQNLYYSESIKCKAVIDTFKGGNVNTPCDMV
jgi:hypothetical protein